MIINVRASALLADPLAVPSALAVGPTMTLTTDSDFDVDNGIASPASSWKPPWEMRRDTRAVMDGVGYDTVAMDSFFEYRPERAWVRFTQVIPV